jgi:hypothetical protein
MERFHVKRGLMKQVNADGGLIKLAREHFEDVKASGDDGFEGRFAILSLVSGEYGSDGTLLVEVQQMKGDELSDFLEQEDGREQAMESRQRWSAFLDAATGYDAKKRGDKAKEFAKKRTKSLSAVKQARHFLGMSTSLTNDTRVEAEGFIVEIEEALERGDFTRADGRAKKLAKLLEG